MLRRTVLAATVALLLVAGGPLASASGFACNSGFTDCSGSCVDLNNDLNNCGACGVVCTGAPHISVPECGGVGVGCNGACDTGWGDCNGDKSVAGGGCEASLNTAQSNSPAIWGGADLNAGYTRVGTIANCGACGVTCDDGNPCTTDLCVPLGATGVCRHYDRAQCGGARCSGVLPPGTPVPIEPACAGADDDGDGLSNLWETTLTDPYTGVTNVAAGVDLNCNGIISAADGDLIWHEAPNPAAKDIYLQYDYMTMEGGSGIACATDADCMTACSGGMDCTSGVLQNERCVANVCTHSHDPLPAATTQVVTAFANQGITLHIDPTHNALTEVTPIYFPVQSGAEPCTGASLYTYKGANFDPRRLIGYRYAVFAHDSCYSGGTENQASGMAEIFGNDLIISMGAFTYVSGNSAVNNVNRTRETAGTFLHELGHNLNLHHGGNDDLAQKPNYISSMSYLFQLTGIYRSSVVGCVPGSALYTGCSTYDATTPVRIDFSSDLLETLTETALVEANGIGVTTPPRNRDITKYFPGPVNAPASGGIDWNQDGVISGTVTADIDGTVATVLPGYNDWANLQYSFQCTPQFADGASPPSGLAATHELTLGYATANHLRSGARKCTGKKLTAAGKKAQSRAKCDAKAVAKGAVVDSGCLAAASDKFAATWMKLDAVSDCPTHTDESSIENLIDGFTNGLVIALEPSGTQPSHCTAKKIQLAASKAVSKVKCYAQAATKGTGVDGSCLTTASSKFSTAWTKLDASGKDCLTHGDVSSIENGVDFFVSQLTGDLTP